MSITLVTHGDAEKDKPNPLLTEEGKAQMEELRSQLPKASYVVSGKSNRCKEACKILTGKRAHLETEKAGVSETLSSDRERIIFPDGKEISLTEYRETLKTKLPEIQAFLKELFQREKEVLLIGGRIVGLAVGIPEKEVRSARIYHIERTESGISITENPVM